MQGHDQILVGEKHQPGRKAGTRYYRLKTVDNDGRSSYSAIRPVLFSNDVQWQVYPNPSSGIFYVTMQAAEGESVNIKVYDVTGKVVQEHRLIATGFMQKIQISLSVTGLYLAQVKVGGESRSFKLTRQ